MKITYTGRQVELAPAQLKKLEARFAKIGKLLDGRRECEAHVVLRWSAICIRPKPRSTTSIISSWGSARAATCSPRSTPPPRSWKSRRSRRAPSGATSSARRARSVAERRRRDAGAPVEGRAGAGDRRRVYHVNQHQKQQADDARGGPAGDGEEAATTWSTATPRPTGFRCWSAAATETSTWSKVISVCRKSAVGAEGAGSPARGGAPAEAARRPSRNWSSSPD